MNKVKSIYTVWVISDQPDQADQVMSERLGHDEDYGFDYTVNYEFNQVDVMVENES